MRLLAIDTGNSGALSWFEDGKIIEIFNMPTYKVKKGKKMATILDFHELDRIFLNVSPHKVIIEQVSSMPGQGVASTFKFGVNYGALQALGACYADEVVLVRPQVWKKHFDLIGTEKRDATRLAKTYTALATNSGKADSYLIGLWFEQTRNR